MNNSTLPESFANPATKEVLRYRQALRVGFEQVQGSGLLTCNHIIQIQGELERNNAGFRKLPGRPFIPCKPSRPRCLTTSSAFAKATNKE